MAGSSQQRSVLLKLTLWAISTSSLPYEAHLYSPVVDIADACGALRKECCNGERHCSIWDVIAVMINALQLTPLRTCMPCALASYAEMATCVEIHGRYEWLASPAMVIGAMRPRGAAHTAPLLRDCHSSPTKPRLRRALMPLQLFFSS